MSRLEYLGNGLHFDAYTGSVMGASLGDLDHIRTRSGVGSGLVRWEGQELSPEWLLKDRDTFSRP